MNNLDWWRNALRALIRLNDGPWRWALGIQAGLANGIPLAFFTIVGRQGDGLVAMLGAFTALYFARLHLVDRRRTLPLIVAGFTVASGIGAATSGTVWTTILALVLIAVVACLLAFSFGVGPPGPMMFVLVAGVSGHITAPRELGGGAGDPLRITLLVATGAVTAFLIVLAPLALPSVRNRQEPPTPLPVLLAFSRFDHVSRIIVTRILLAVTIASVSSIPMGVPRAYWVIMTAGALLQIGHTLQVPTIRAIQRVIGTIIGVGIFWGLSRLHLTGLQVALAVALLQGLSETVIARNYGLGLLFITPLALTISTTVGTSDALTISKHRVGDTILGATIALLVLFATEWWRRRDGSAAPE